MRSKTSQSAIGPMVVVVTGCLFTYFAHAEKHGIQIVLLDMIHVPDWAFEAAGQEMRVLAQEAAYDPGLYLTPAQREAVEALIQELPKFRLKAVPTDCSECPICLEEFRDENERCLKFC